MNKKISVIVPVYNAEKYIQRCLSSICNSSISDLEVLVIDNGSHDRSKEKILESMRQDERIVYYYYADKGVSGARNLGLAYATGDLIAFVDADDFIEPFHFETLLQSKDAELSVVNFYHYYQKDGTKTQNQHHLTGYYTKKEIGKHFWEFYDGYILNPVWNKLYHRHLIEKYHLRFVEHQFMGEDALFNFTYLKYCKMIAISKLASYAYSFHDEQTIYKANPNYFDNIMKLYEEIQQFLVRTDCFDLYHKSYYERLYQEVLRSISKVCQSNVTFVEKKNYLKNIAEDVRVKLLIETRWDIYAFLLRNHCYVWIQWLYAIYRVMKGVRNGNR